MTETVDAHITRTDAAESAYTAHFEAAHADWWRALSRGPDLANNVVPYFDTRMTIDEALLGDLFQGKENPEWSALMKVVSRALCDEGDTRAELVAWAEMLAAGMAEKAADAAMEAPR